CDARRDPARVNGPSTARQGPVRGPRGDPGCTRNYDRTRGNATPMPEAQELPLWLNGLLFVAAGVVVWIAGTRLTHALDAIADKTGLGQLFVGMLLLGGITSLP